VDPLINNVIDPALLRILDKRGQERDSQLRRKRMPAAEPPGEEKEDRDKRSENEAAADSPKHELDDLA